MRGFTQEFIMPSILECDQYHNPVTNKWHNMFDEHKRIWSYLNKCTPEDPEGYMRKGFRVSQSEISDICRIEKHVVTRFISNLTKAGYLSKSANYIPGQRVENTYSILNPLVARLNPRWEHY